MTKQEAAIRAAFTTEQWAKVARPAPTGNWVSGVPGRRFEIFFDPETPVLGTIAKIDGEDVPNFVLPAWYVPGSVGPWDAAGVLTGPQSVTPNGYYLADDEGGVGDVWSHPPGRAALMAVLADENSALAQAVSQIEAARKGVDWAEYHEKRFHPPAPPPENEHELPAAPADPAAES